MTPCFLAARLWHLRAKLRISQSGDRFLKIVLCLFAFVGAQPALANPRISAICDAAADVAARRTGVPLPVLQAITLAETGRKSGAGFLPWPWTVNMEGKGEWFASREAAQDFAEQNFGHGARSFDVGCFQLNYKWHGQAFASIRQMFDPNTNAIYAANFLRELYVEKGNWVDAAGAYHSRTPVYSNRYKKRFARILADISPDMSNAPVRLVAAATETEQVFRPTQNNFPLLQSGSRSMAGLGSLMPDSAGVGGHRLFGGG